MGKSFTSKRRGSIGSYLVNKKKEKKKKRTWEGLMTVFSFLLSKVTGSVNNTINLLSRTNKEPGLFYAACLSHVIEESDTIQQRVTQWKKKLKDRMNRNG